MSHTPEHLQVKDLLESGHTLHAPLLQKLVSQFAQFVVGAGMLRYSYWLLPIFTFIRKCCGVSDATLENLLIHALIDKLVYSPPDAPPRPTTPLFSSMRPSSQAGSTAASRRV